MPKNPADVGVNTLSEAKILLDKRPHELQVWTPEEVRDILLTFQLVGHKAAVEILKEVVKEMPSNSSQKELNKFRRWLDREILKHRKGMGDV